MSIRLIKEYETTLYCPTADHPEPGSLYPRVIELHHGGGLNGALLATFEQYEHSNPVFPIYRSNDHGKSWSCIASVVDTKNHWGNRFQPHLYELPRAVAGFAEGTILLAGNSIPDDLSATEIVLYVSEDHGVTWRFLSAVARGGAPRVDDPSLSLRPVWEPFLLLGKNDELICYYSDERFVADGYNQLLSYQVSVDGGRTWGDEVFMVAIPDGHMRPGMPVIAALPDGRYFMSYEMVGLPRWDVFFRISEDGLHWGEPNAMGTHVETASGQFLGSTPYCLWAPQGGPYGTVIVSARREGEGDGVRNPGYFFTNSNNGVGPWERVPMPVVHDSSIGFTGYSQGMCLADRNRLLVHMCPVEIDRQRAKIVCTLSRIETV